MESKAKRRVIMAKEVGFCFGVKRAINLTRQALAERERLAADAVALRDRLQREWDARRTELLALMRKLARRTGESS